MNAGIVSGSAGFPKLKLNGYSVRLVLMAAACTLPRAAGESGGSTPIGAQTAGGTEACCFTDTSCIDLQFQDCVDAGGHPTGEPACLPGLCDLGACCTGGISCDDGGGAGIDFAACGVLGGVYFGGVFCDTAPCVVSISARPNPDPAIDIAGSTAACLSDADCPGESYCIPDADGALPGDCYVPANRYLSIAPNLNNAGILTARRISIDGDGDGIFTSGVDPVLGWVDDPFATTVTGPESSPQAQSRIVDVPVYRGWSDLSDVHPSFAGDVPIRLGDCEISPGHTYFVQAITLGNDTGNEGNYSAALGLRTVLRWADVTGSFDLPDGSATMDDSDAIVAGFQAVQTVPKYRLELIGNGAADDVPDFALVTLTDNFAALAAIQGGGYPNNAPCDCAGQVCSVTVVSCCMADGSCAEVSPALCATGGTAVATCLGDGDGDQIDDACGCECIADITGGPQCGEPNGSIDFVDVSFLIQCAENQTDPCGSGSIDHCDVNCDGIVDFQDVGVAVLQFQSGSPDPTACDVPTGACCADGEPCYFTQQDTCTFLFPGATYEGDGTTCTPDPCGCVNNTDCEDGNPCTDDVCEMGLCVNLANIDPCDDGDACTTNDTCAAGICVGGPPPVCDDLNPCTDDSCDPANGCITTNNNDPCDDLDACTTNDTCTNGACAGGAPPICDDGNPCTDDSCDLVLGCVNAPNVSPCDDGNECTTNDTCAATVCVGGPPPICDDGNVCTDDSCDPGSGCQNVPNNGPCSDGVGCTDDVCSGSSCVGTPNDANCPDDGQFCNGEEFCDALNDCSSTGTPCQPGESCDEANDTCTLCLCSADMPNLPTCSAPNGVVTFADSLYILQCIQQGADPCGGPIETCDINCDGNVDAIDYGLTILQFQNVPDTCNVPVGSCCTTDVVFGPCTLAHETVCELSLQDGVYAGDGSTCPDCTAGDAGCDDCNANQTIDYCDILSGTSEDIDADDVPDECTSFIGAVDNNWSTPGNWNGNVVPNNSGEDVFYVTIDALGFAPSQWQTNREPGAWPGTATRGAVSTAGPGFDVVIGDVDVQIHGIRLLNGVDFLVETVPNFAAGPTVDFDVVGPGGVVVHSEPQLNEVSEFWLGEAQNVVVHQAPTIIDAGGSLSLAQGVDPGESTYTTDSLTITTDCGACNPGIVHVSGAMTLNVNKNLEITTPDGCTETCAGPTAGPGADPPPTLSLAGENAINIGGDWILEAGAGVNVNTVGTVAVHLAGDLVLEMRDTDVFQWFNGELVLDGTEPQIIEAADPDVGPSGGGLANFGTNGFQIPALRIENFDVEFRNVVVNQTGPPDPCPCSEAFYVGTLDVPDGATVVVNNVHVYVDELTGGDFNIIRIGCGDLILNPTVTTLPPLSEPFDVGAPHPSEDPCCDNNDCVNESVCIASYDQGELGACYIPLNRYLAFRSQESGQTAIRIMHDSGAGWFVHNTVNKDGYRDLLPLTAAPSLILDDWSLVGSIVVAGCGIAPDTTYAVQALRQGDSRTNEHHYSVPLRLPTAAFGDIVETDAPVGGVVLPGDGIKNTIDVFSVARAFSQTAPFPPVLWADLEEPVNKSINLADAFWAVLAFQGVDYFELARDQCECVGACTFQGDCPGDAACGNYCVGGFNNRGPCDIGNGNADCINGISDGVCNPQTMCGPCQ